MVPELVVLALEYHRAPLRYRHLADPRRRLPRQFSRLIGELGSALSPQNREATARALGVPADALEQAAGFFLRDVLLTPTADHYRVLGLNRRSSPEDIRQHYQLLVGVFHPDRSTGDRERDAACTARLNDAYNTLRNPEKRARYDQQTRQDDPGGNLEVDDRDFFRPLTPVAFPGPGAAPRPSRSAQRLMAISILAVLAVGVMVFLLVRPSHQPTLRASADLRSQPPQRPAYLAQPEAATPRAGRSRQMSEAAVDAPATADAASAERAAPGEVPLNAGAGPMIAESRDAIRVAVLEGREDLLAQIQALPRISGVPRAGRVETARRGTDEHGSFHAAGGSQERSREDTPPQAGPTASELSLAETGRSSAISGQSLDVAATPTASAQAGGAPPVEAPAGTTGGRSREAAGETATVSPQQADAPRPAPPATVEPVAKSNGDRVAAVEPIPAAPVAGRLAVSTAEATPKGGEEPSREQEVAAAGPPDTAVTPPAQPQATRETQPATDRQAAAAVAAAEPAGPTLESTNKHQNKPARASKVVAAADLPAGPAEPKAHPKRQAEPAREARVATKITPVEPAAPKSEPPPKRQPDPPKGKKVAAAAAPPAEPAEPRPKGPPPLSPADIVDRLMQTYGNGDLDGFMRLFAANAQINGGSGIRHIRSRYADMFGRLPERRLIVQNLSWRKAADDRVIGKGAIQLSARTGPRSEWGHASGSITLELVSATGGYRIAKMIHRLD